MAEVGTAFVSIVPSAKGFGSKLNAEAGTASATAGKSSSKRFGSAFSAGFKGAFAGLGIAAAVGGGISLLKSAVGEAREAQKVGALTTAIIKATGGAANVTAGQVSKLSTSISNKTAVDDEAIQKGANLLLTFKNVRNEAGKGADIFNQATAAAVDLSAAGFGSIDSASKMLGKALNDPVKGMSALSRAGVTFTAGQQKQIKAMVKSGDLLGAQKIILGEVKSQVGGAGAASATAGEKMKVAWNNAKESLGTALLPAIDKLQIAITTKILPAIVKFIGFLQANPAIVKAFAIAIGAIAAAFLVAFIAANAVVIGIGLLVGALVYAYTKSETFRTIVNAVFKAVWAYIKFHVKMIVAIIKTAIKIIIATWNFLKRVPGIVRGAFNAAKNFISTAIKAAVRFVSNGVKDIVKWFKDLPGKIKRGLGNLGKLLVDKGKDLVRGLINGIKKMGKAVGRALISLLPGPVRKFASFLGLASPSKLFAKFGKWTVEGYVQGIDKQRRTVTPAMSRLADTAILPASGFAGPRLSSVAPASSSIPDMTIVDGTQVIGYFRDIATKRARIELAAYDQTGTMTTRFARP
jgi:hypothetical protein